MAKQLKIDKLFRSLNQINNNIQKTYNRLFVLLSSILKIKLHICSLLYFILWLLFLHSFFHIK
jgi:hypothetical protein